MSTFDLSAPIGHGEAIAQLASLATAESQSGNSRRHHAYLFTGPAGVGKFRTALWWASRLKCERAGDGGCFREPAAETPLLSPPPPAGGLCRSCTLLAGDVHPDVNVVERFKDKRSLLVEQARELVTSMPRRPAEPGPRIAILRDAHLLTTEAQNSLLKLLEEPPGHAVLMLVADNADAVLATVRSRCQNMRFRLLTFEETAAVLRKNGRSEAEARSVAALSGGSLASAEDYDEEGLVLREAVLTGLERWLRSGGDLEGTVELITGNKRQVENLSEILRWQLRKIHASVSGGNDAADDTQPSHLTEIDLEPSPALRKALQEAASADPRELIEQAEGTRAALLDLRRNVNAKIVLRDLLIQVRS